MPGTLRAELYEMEIADALAILLSDVADDELAQAARHVVELDLDMANQCRASRKSNVSSGKHLKGRGFIEGAHGDAVPDDDGSDPGPIPECLRRAPKAAAS
jgi:hypothetical protein